MIAILFWATIFWGVFIVWIIVNRHDTNQSFTKRQTYFLVGIGGPITWIGYVVYYMLIGGIIFCNDIFPNTIIARNIKWFWNDFLGDKK